MYVKMILAETVFNFWQAGCFPIAVRVAISFVKSSMYSPIWLGHGGRTIIRFYAPVAQWIEHWPPEPGVAGSNPAGRANLLFFADFKPVSNIVK